MASDNLLQELMTNEDGATAFLATLLRPEIGHPLQSMVWKLLAQCLSTGGIEIPPDAAPTLVRQQYLNMDLVVLWADWVIVLENKVNAASITRNQLNRYYRVSLKALLVGQFLDDPSLRDRRLAVIYLTPTANAGTLEFASLELAADRRDHKLHLGWPAILELLRTGVRSLEPVDPFVRIFNDGCQVIEGMLARSRSPKTLESPERDATRCLLNEVQVAIDKQMRSQGPIKLNRWKDPTYDQLYGCWQGGKCGNVYLDVFAEGTNLTAKTRGTLHARLQFWLRTKDRRHGANWFTKARGDDWAQQLGLNRTQLEVIDDGRGVAFEDVWEGDGLQVKAELGTLFCRFLMVFRPLMEGKFNDPIELEPPPARP